MSFPARIEANSRQRYDDRERTRPDGVKSWPADNIDPIEELARMRDAKDEGRYDDLADAPKLIKAATRRPRRVRR
jgi:hypothetical protein